MYESACTPEIPAWASCTLIERAQAAHSGGGASPVTSTLGGATSPARSLKVWPAVADGAVAAPATSTTAANFVMRILHLRIAPPSGVLEPPVCDSVRTERRRER